MISIVGSGGGDHPVLFCFSFAMGFIEVETFCCGLANLDRGCRLISLVTLCYSCLLFTLSCATNGTKEEAHAAYVLLILTTLLIYGVVERTKLAVMAYLALRAATLALVLADMMRTLAQVLHKVKRLDDALPMLMLGGGDFCKWYSCSLAKL